MLNNEVRQRLQQLITHYGHSVFNDVKQCEALLRDFCPEYKRELNLLILSLREGVPQQLLKPAPHVSVEFTVKHLAQTLHDNLGIAEHFAFWAVESWALSLQLIPYPITQTSQPTISSSKQTIHTQTTTQVSSGTSINSKKSNITQQPTAQITKTTQPTPSKIKQTIIQTTIGGVVLLMIMFMMSGGGSKPVDKSQEIQSFINGLVKGNKYILKSANSYDPAATVRLVAVPGAAAYDDTEETDRTPPPPCQHIPQGTPVTIIELQDAYGTKNAFVKVLIDEGECKGKEGWALSNVLMP